MQRILTLLSILLISGLLAIPALAANGSSPEEKLATLAALEFVELIDRGEYALSWDDSSLYFKNKTDRSDWIQEITHLRPHYGQNHKRTLQLAKFIDKSADTDDQPLIFIIFRSNFEKKTAIEMVTTVKDSDAKWRVAGYSLQ